MEIKEIIKMYDLVFEDMVQCRIEDYNYDLEENEKYQTINESEQKEIARRLICKSEYMWEVINETIDYELNRIINNR